MEKILSKFFRQTAPVIKESVKQSVHVYYISTTHYSYDRVEEGKYKEMERKLLLKLFMDYCHTDTKNVHVNKYDHNLNQNDAKYLRVSNGCIFISSK